MIALIIAEGNTVGLEIQKRVKPYGFRCIHYHSALKALDNIPEIQPDLIFISATDYPRHWKTIAQFIRSQSNKNDTVIVLLINERFTDDDADKALYIGIQAIVNETFSNEKDENQLASIFNRYKKLHTDIRDTIIDPNPTKISFMFNHPTSLQIITGSIKTLSIKEIQFYVDTPSATSDLPIGRIIKRCTLGINDKLIYLECTIEKNTTYLVLSFKTMTENDKLFLEKFIQGTIE